MTDIFISYSSRDRDKVRRVRDALAKLRFNVFWDQDTPAGVNWDELARKHLGKAKVVIVFWSRAAAASPNVQHEAAIAVEGNKLIPVQIEPMRSIDFPMGFYTIQAPKLHDWTGADSHAGYASMIRAVRAMMAATPAQNATSARTSFEVDIADLRKRAKAGDADAQVQLGYMHDIGKGMQKNLGEALRLYRLAAEQGDHRAQYNLGVSLAKGEGVKKNEREAARLYGLSAEQGYAPAQHNLGFMHEKGQGVGKNEAAAARLYRAAAEQGYPPSQFRLGRMYARGMGGLPCDRAEAARLLGLAAKAGVKEARPALNKLGPAPAQAARTVMPQVRKPGSFG
jgi:hypothetical protein